MNDRKTIPVARSLISQSCCSKRSYSDSQASPRATSEKKRRARRPTNVAISPPISAYSGLMP